MNSMRQRGHCGLLPEFAAVSDRKANYPFSRIIQLIPLDDTSRA